MDFFSVPPGPELKSAQLKPAEVNNSGVPLEQRQIDSDTCSQTLFLVLIDSLSPVWQ